MWFEGNTLHWHYISLELLKMPGPLVNANIVRDKSNKTISTHCQQTSICTVHVHPNSVWSQKTILNAASKAPLLDDKAKQFIQQVCSKLLFLGRAVNSTLLCPISTITSQSSKPTMDMMRQTLQLLDYLAMQEDVVLSYHARNMVLAVHSNASYLSKPEARSRAKGHFFLSSDTTVPPNNGAALNIAHIIKNIMSLAPGVGTSRTVHHGTHGSVHQDHTQQIRTQATANASTNQQCNGRHCHQW